LYILAHKGYIFLTPEEVGILHKIYTNTMSHKNFPVLGLLDIGLFTANGTVQLTLVEKWCHGLDINR
jgi:hypothetical protein